MPRNDCGPKSGVSRRKFLTAAVAAGGGLVASAAHRLLGVAPGAMATEPELTPQAYLPLVMKRYPSVHGARVVHVHDLDATDWDFSTGYYGDYVDQDVVDEMVDQGVMALTSTSSVAEAWRQLIPDYQPGKALAIKVNFNNSGHNDPLQIDALIHPINSVVRRLELIGVGPEDVWVYDAVRCIPDRFINGCLYPGVRFFDSWCHERATFDSEDPDAVVHFADHTQKITDVVVNATYLINMPIIKRHGAGYDFSVTLSFKNHYGTIHTPRFLHEDRSSRLLALNTNLHIRYKTRLVIGDALFGNWRDNWKQPEPWDTFGNAAPNSLFFATDPVTVDSLMCDFLEAEEWINDEPDEYLQWAEEAGLGVYERGDPWQQPYGSGYDRIDYVRLGP